jgi:hypothetical protein
LPNILASRISFKLFLIFIFNPWLELMSTEGRLSNVLTASNRRRMEFAKEKEQAHGLAKKDRKRTIVKDFPAESPRSAPSRFFCSAARR